MNYNAQPEGLRIPEEFLPADDGAGRVGGAQAREFLDLLWNILLMGGDPDFDYLVEYICDYPWYSERDKSAELEGISETDAERLAEYLIEQRLAQQRAFGDVPPMPITQAFAELERQGVLARENFTCCQTCGHDEILTQVTEPERWLAYVFFHQQDTENMFETGDGALAFGLAPGGRANGIDLGELIRTIVLPTLGRHGITATWDGNVRARILISGTQLYYPLEPLTGG